jgi:hypothetical protein
MAHCNEVWLASGLDRMMGHSFRIGGTTHLLVSGVDPWVVMKQGSVGNMQASPLSLFTYLLSVLATMDSALDIVYRRILP